MMDTNSLLRLVPPILRARDFRLYTRNGRRLVDLWQYGGAAILGHTPAGLLRALKNTAERGLFAPLPHPQEQRFIKALAVLLPGMTFRLYRSDTALRCALPSTPILWRPFLDTVLPPDRPLIPVLPLPWPDAPRVLALPSTLPEAAFPASELLSPLTLAAATRSVYDLIAATPARGRVHYPRIEEALTKSVWKKQGIYLYCDAKVDDEIYTETFKQFLEQGFLIPPAQDQPLILPGVLSAGEEAKLAECITGSPGELEEASPFF
ncbi:hypothetical protein AGMMS49942_25270 [Spirochaetia bacterium]|nr:hypothetical protein AGMMS49942_25270 [Spirochaetia bacterium]